MTNCETEKKGNKNMSKVKDENYINIPGWAVTRLGLKGNELLVYSIIYGFSQDGETRFTGSLQYLADWTNSTKQSCIKCLKSLAEKGYITKDEKIVNGVKFCEYKAVISKSMVVNKVEQGSKQSLTWGIKQSLPNNLVSDNREDKLEDKKEIYSRILSHLNEKAGTNYRYTTTSTQRLINGRLSDGFTVEDFINMIDTKCAEWAGTEMDKYLRPETLFGSKVENYLNQHAKQPRKQNQPPKDDDNEAVKKARDKWGDLPGFKIV